MLAVYNYVYECTFNECCHTLCIKFNIFQYTTYLLYISNLNFLHDYSFSFFKSKEYLSNTLHDYVIA